MILRNCLWVAATLRCPTPAAYRVPGPLHGHRRAHVLRPSFNEPDRAHAFVSVLMLKRAQMRVLDGVEVFVENAFLVFIARNAKLS